MGTETVTLPLLAFHSAFSVVKLNNPLMETETLGHILQLVNFEIVPR